jgi:hypothetical protein
LCLMVFRMSRRTLSIGFLFFAAVARRGAAQCVPANNSTKVETFSALRDVAPVLDGPAGIELSLTERGRDVVAMLRDYEGSSNPLEARLEGTLTGCELNLVGHNARGRVEVRGEIGVANFNGVIIRQIGKQLYSEKVSIRRKKAESTPFTTARARQQSKPIGSG